jgi:hypothetical protein
MLQNKTLPVLSSQDLTSEFTGKRNDAFDFRKLTSGLKRSAANGACVSFG